MSKFVVGIDGSEASIEAVRWAAHAASLEGASLRLIYSYDATVSNYAPGLVIPEDVIAALIAEAQNTGAAAAQIAAATAPGVRIETAVVAGRAANVLLEAGRGATIVLGTRGLGGVRGALQGSVGVNVAAHHPGRTVIVRSDVGQPNGGPVVVGVSDEPVSDPAVREAFNQAALRGVGLVAVHAWSQLDADVLKGHGLGVEVVEEANAAAARALAERVSGFGAEFPEVTVERRLLVGDPASALTETADGKASLVVVGSRGRAGFTGLLLGSTSQDVLHRAKCPVMIVHDS